MIGQPPLPNGLGKKYRVSADCVDINIVDKYQLGKFGLDKEKTEEVVSTTEKVDDIKNLNKEDSNASDSKKERV